MQKVFKFVPMDGVETSNSWDGLDLSDLLLSREDLPARELFWRHANGNLAIRRGDWKWVSMGGGQLFDIGNDPYEKYDRSAEELELAAELKAAAFSWFKEVSAGVKRRA